MKVQALWKPLSLGGVFTILMVAYTNCSQPKLDENLIASAQSSQPSTSSTLQLGPQNQVVNWGSSLQLITSGGNPPYFYQLLSGGGSLDQSGFYHAPDFDSTAVIRVMDSAGALAQTTIRTSISSNSSMTLSYSVAAIRVNDVVKLTAAGGQAPYTYSLKSGVGMVSGDNYYATAGGTGVLVVRDNHGAQALFNVTVSTSVEIVSHPIYRTYNRTVYQYSYSKSSGTTAGWEAQGAMFRLLSNDKYLNTLPLKRCKLNDKQGGYLSTSGCSSFTDEGLLGYVYMYAAAGSIPLYSCFRSDKGTYMYSTDAQECLNNHFSVQSVRVGYVLPK